jgi:alkaline phosphatase D
MWDDHDYGENNGDMYATWKPLATQAFREYHPNYPRANSSGGNWYKFRCAQSEIFVLDLRSQRDNRWDTDNEQKSMLDGNNIPDGQKAWLLSGLKNSTATWKFILSTVPFNPTVVKDDSWFGYRTEQAEIVDFINDHEIKNVIFVSGDIHTGGAIDDGSNSFFPEISVPHSNFQFQLEIDCAAWDCGDWSEGLFSGYEANGFALIDVTSDYVDLMTWSRSGENQISHIVWKE